MNDSVPTSLAARVAELEAELERERRVSTALREVGNALGTTLDLDDLLELILAHLRELIDADRATLYVLDEQTGDLLSRIVVGEQVRSIRMKVGHGIAGAVAANGESIRIADAYMDPRFEREWDLLTGYRTTSMLAAPLKNHLGRTIGVIQALNKRNGGEFGDDDELMVRALSTQAAVAIDNSRLMFSLIQKNRLLQDTKLQLERRIGEMQLLFELERRTARAETMEALVSATLELMVGTADARGGALLLAEEDTGDLVEYCLDAEVRGLRRLPAKSADGLLPRVMSDAETLNVDDVRSSAEVRREWLASLPFPVRSLLAVPLEGDTRPIGAIAIFAEHRSDPFDAEDLELLRLVAANVSTAVRLYRAGKAREVGERLTSIGRLLSQVVHDFKTPFTVISGYVQLMQDEDDPEVRRDYVERVLEQFDNVTAMQREVLAFARGESTLFVRRVQLRKFFGDLRRQLELELEGKPVQLVLEIDTKATARFDEERLARAIHNLARNAVEAMAERGGVLRIEARLEGTQLVVRVMDTGPGIPKEIEGRLFQTFVTAGKKGGTGLGLAIVKKIVEEHGGQVRVRSTSGGAVFELSIPQVTAPARERRGSGEMRAVVVPRQSSDVVEP